MKTEKIEKCSKCCFAVLNLGEKQLKYNCVSPYPCDTASKFGISKRECLKWK